MRWLRNIFALLAIASVMLWVMSQYYGIRTGTPLSKPDSQIELNIYWGRVSVSTSYGGTPNYQHGWYAEVHYIDMRFDIESMNEAGMEMPMPEDYPVFEYLPYSFADPAGRWTWSGTSIVFPIWLPTLLFGAWPATALALHIKRRYFTKGICRKCGYDLRGSPAGVCSECGHEPRTANTV
jgi:ribosomal protein L40E